MPKDWTEEPWIEAPDVAGAFDRARQAEKKKRQEPKPDLALKPPAPSPMGLVVSPQLKREQAMSELKKAMRMAREFRSRARDPFER